LAIEELKGYLQEQDEKLRKNMKDAYGVFSKGSKDRRTIIEQSFAAGVLFVDPDFPPSMESILKSNKVDIEEDLNSIDTIELPLVEWRRTNEFIEGELCVFGDKIEFNDVIFGENANTWLLCALSSVSQIEQVIRELIPELQCNPQTGLYVVRLCKDGSWKTIVLDSFIPCVPKSGPIYSYTRDQKLWVPLIEKAFAKYHGSYNAIRDGWPHEAMIDLTGAPYMHFQFDDARAVEAVADGSLWAKLKAYSAQRYIISLQVSGDSESAEGSLVPGHTYSVVEAMEFNEHKVFKILNLWGNFDWKGDWNCSSPLWTEEAKLALKNTEESDKVFWMSFKDVISFFIGVNICMVRKIGVNVSPWKEERKNIEYKFKSDGSGVESVSIYKMIIAGEGAEMYAAIHQPDNRRIGAPAYFDFGLTILKDSATKGEFKCVGTCGNTVDRQNQIEILPGTIPSGTFYLVPTSTGCRVNSQTERISGAGRTVSALDLSRQAVVSVHCEYVYL
jgi:hypothetical protein